MIILLIVFKTPIRFLRAASASTRSQWPEVHVFSESVNVSQLIQIS